MDECLHSKYHRRFEHYAASRTYILYTIPLGNFHINKGNKKELFDRLCVILTLKTDDIMI